MLDLIYWPTVQMLMWGFLQLYVTQNGGLFARAGGMFIGAVLLWDILFRGQLGFSVSFLEEMWSHNLANLMMTPLRPVEFVAALMIMSIVRLLIGMVPVTLLAVRLLRIQSMVARLRARRLLRQFDLDQLGDRHFRRRAWCCATAWAPRASPGPSCSCSCRSPACTTRLRCCPDLLQYVAWSLPPTYVFEGMRALLIDHVFRADLMLEALAFNVVLFAAASFAFLKLLQSARRAGLAAADRRISRKAMRVVGLYRPVSGRKPDTKDLSLC